ncbi:glycosyltransferase family 39 protein [Candidatus Altiarchaeota archaeon]
MEGKKGDWVGLGIAFTFLILGLYTLADYGITIDSPENFLWGDVYFRYYLTGRSDYLRYGAGENPLLEEPIEQTYIFYKKNKYRPWMYPPVANILSALTKRIFHEKLGWVDHIQGHHIAIIILSSITVYAVYSFTREVYGGIPAALAAVSLSLYPRFMAHSHNNVKEAPLACFFLLTMWSFWKMRKTREFKWVIISPIMLGLSVNVKINAYFIPIILGIWILTTVPDKPTRVDLPSIKKEDGNIRCTSRTYHYPFAYNIFIITLIACLTIYASWPYLWDDPKANIIKSMEYFYDQGGQTPMLYNGDYYDSASKIPSYYAPHMLLIVTPEAILFFIAIGLWRLSDHFMAGGEMKSMSILLLSWISIPLIKYLVPGTVVYNGIRHFLEVVPPLCMIAGIGGGWMFQELESQLRRLNIGMARSLTSMFFILLFLPIAYMIAVIHPYEIVYYNSLIGGINGAEGNFELDYWGTSLKGSTEWVQERNNENVGVLIPLWPHISRYYHNETYEPEEENYVILLNNREYFNVSWIGSNDRKLIRYVNENMEPEHTIDVDGVPLVKVYKANKSTLYSAVRTQ